MIMTENENSVEDMLRGMAPRPAPSEDARARVFAAVEQEWHARQLRRRARWMAVAATVLIGIAVAVFVVDFDSSFEVRLADVDVLQVADVQYTMGGEQLRIDGNTGMSTRGASRLIGPDGADLRLQAGTRIRWLGPEAIALDHGAVYVATHGNTAFEVRTAMGVVTDIGTRFMVTLVDDELEVAMRQGITEIATDHGTYRARGRITQGDVVRVTDERITARAEAASDARWSWIHEVHPGYSQTRIVDLLDAIAADLGLPLEFASPAVRASIMALDLQGDISQLSPEAALQVVLGSAGIRRVDQDGERLLIGFQ